MPCNKQLANNIYNNTTGAILTMNFKFFQGQPRTIGLVTNRSPSFTVCPTDAFDKGVVI